MPFQINKSKKDPSKGLAVFSTLFIPKNSLLCCYIGTVGTNEDVVIGKNDSLYSVGYISCGEKVKEMLIIPL